MRPLSLNAALAVTVAALALPFVPAAAEDLVGVASCDKFLNVYTSCVAAKLPAAQQSKVLATLEQTRGNWKAVAATADGKSKLDATCKETAAKMKKDVAALNCAW